MTTTQQGSTTDLAARVAEKGEAPLAPGKTLFDEVRDLTPQLAMAIPPGIITPERFVRTAITTIRKNTDLLNCTKASFLGAMMTAAQLGLEVEPSLGQAYLIPYGQECTLIIGYKGYIELAFRGGIIMESKAVREHDRFDFDFGSDSHLGHGWKLGEPRGEIIGYWGKASFPDGRTKFHVMDLEDIAKRRARSASASGKRSPWHSDPEAMSMKTVIRAMIPQIPLTTELSRALEVDEGIVTMRGADRELAVSFPDPIIAGEVGQGQGPDTPPQSQWRQDSEAEVDVLLHEAANFEDAQRWFVSTYGTLPNMDDAGLAQALAGLKAWLDEDSQSPTEPPAGDSRSQGSVTPPVDAEARSVASGSRPPAGSAGPEDLNQFAAQAVTLVAGMKGPQIKETIHLFRQADDPPVPSDVGSQRTLLITILERELRAGNQNARDLF